MRIRDGYSAESQARATGRLNAARSHDQMMEGLCLDPDVETKNHGDHRERSVDHLPDHRSASLSSSPAN